MAVQTKAPACHVKQPPPPSKPYCVGITPALAKQRPQLGSESFSMVSEGNVRHPRAPPANVPAGRLRACEPRWGPFARPQTLLRCGQCRLPGVKPFPGPLAALLHCSFFYGLPKATLDTHGPRPQTSLQAVCAPANPSGGRLPARKSPEVRTVPSARRQTLPGTSGRTPALQLFLWASEGNVRHPRPRPQTSLQAVCAPANPSGGRLPARKSPEVRTVPSARRQTLPGTCGRTPALQLCRPKAAAWPRKLFFSGLPKATLDTHGPRPQTSLQAVCAPANPSGGRLPARKPS